MRTAQYLYLLGATLLGIQIAPAQTFNVIINPGPKETIEPLNSGTTGQEIVVSEKIDALRITVSNPVNGETYEVKEPYGGVVGALAGTPPVLDIDENTSTLDPSTEWMDREYEIGKSGSAASAGWHFKLKTNDPKPDKEPPPAKDELTLPTVSCDSIPDIRDALRAFSRAMRTTPYGIQLNDNTAYRGKEYIHLFFDQSGNPLLSTSPQGIANRQYVVHVLYLRKKGTPSRISYAVVQTQGEFSDALEFRNIDDPNPRNLLQSSGPRCELEWTHQEWLLGTSTSNIEFKIVRTVNGWSDKNDPIASATSIATHTIKMTKVYHGSFDIGFVNSKLQNPTFELVTSSVSDTLQVVKKSGGGDRGIVTLMATFYTSPVMWFRGKGTIPDYQRTGRNFLDDHRWYERIYPCIGVGISDEAFENLFFGLNWEIARGGSLFFGAHYGRVNTFTPTSDDFQFGLTPITQEGFELATDTKWQLAPGLSNLSKLSLDQFCFGANIDLRLITRLFSNGGSGSPDAVNQ